MTEEAKPKIVSAEDRLKLNWHKRQHLLTFKRRLEFLEAKDASADRTLHKVRKEISALRWVLGIFDDNNAETN